VLLYLGGMSAKTLQVVAPEPAGEDVAGCAVAYFPSGAPAAARFTAAYRSAANLRHHLRLEGRAVRLHAALL
jgi:hypothetical protein